jgi:single-strand DNA-binding protein
MKNSVNKVALCGYAGAAVEVKNLSKQQKVARVNIAVNEYYKNRDGEEVKRTHWFMLSFWNEQATQAENEIKKGSLINVEGKLQTSSYDTKDGSKRSVTNIIVQEFQVKST